MKQHYHKLELVQVRTFRHTKFAELRQQIDGEVVGGWNGDEIGLWGFGSGKSATERTLLYQIPGEAWELEVLLEEHPKARIVRIISHSPILKPVEVEMLRQGILNQEAYIRRQVVRFGTTVYVDRCGMPVYTQDMLDLEGKLQDQDWRVHIPEAAIETTFRELRTEEAYEAESSRLPPRQ